MITRLDYQCPTCGRVYRDILCEAGEKLLCYDLATCGKATLEILWTTGSSSDFGFSSYDVKPIEVEYDEESPMRGKRRTLSSISEVRAFERETEQMARNGEHSPRVFRHYSQDHSNLTKNVFSHLQPDQTIPRRADGSLYIREAGGLSKEHSAPDSATPTE